MDRTRRKVTKVTSRRKIASARPKQQIMSAGAKLGMGGVALSCSARTSSCSLGTGKVAGKLERVRSARTRRR